MMVRSQNYYWTQVFIDEKKYDIGNWRKSKCPITWGWINKACVVFNEAIKVTFRNIKCYIFKKCLRLQLCYYIHINIYLSRKKKFLRILCILINKSSTLRQKSIFLLYTFILYPNFLNYQVFLFGTKGYKLMS